MATTERAKVGDPRGPREAWGRRALLVSRQPHDGLDQRSEEATRTRR
jgi:hypothetical protein